MAAEAAGEDGFEGAALKALDADASISHGACSSGAGPFSPRPTSAQPSASGTIASEAATADGARSGANLLALKLEAMSYVYHGAMKETCKHEELQQDFYVDLAAELGEGTYGKVYVGTKGRRKGRRPSKCPGGFAIKMLRNEGTEAPEGLDAAEAADQEVRRPVTLGWHPNLVRLVDVGLFWQPASQPRARSSAHVGLAFDLCEIDVRQFLKNSAFTQSGMRHALTSVLEGLGFIHARGCVHSDLKPASIFMRGAIHLRGCFERETWRKRQLAGWDLVATTPRIMTEFECQIASSFDARGSRARTRRFELDSRSNRVGSSSIEL